MTFTDIKIIAKFASVTAVAVASAVLIAVTLFGFALAAPSPAPISPVVKLLSETGSHGTAFHIGNGLFLTADHVVNGNGTMTARLATGETRPVTVLWANAAYDVALVASDPAGLGVLDLDCREPTLDEPVTMIGNPGPVEFVRTYGHVAKASAAALQFRYVFLVSGSMLPGMSGGPVLDGAGNVIGITDATMGMGNAPIPIGMAVPATVVCYLLGRGPAPVEVAT